MLADFRSFYGLDMNAAKSEEFFSGYSNEEKTSLSDLAGIDLGIFPTRYLDFPLSPKKLSFTDLQPFLERITVKLHSWTTKFLSYAGKIRLISSVIYGMINF